MGLRDGKARLDRIVFGQVLRVLAHAAPQARIEAVRSCEVLSGSALPESHAERLQLDA